MDIEGQSKEGDKRVSFEFALSSTETRTLSGTQRNGRLEPVEPLLFIPESVTWLSAGVRENEKPLSQHKLPSRERLTHKYKYNPTTK